MNKKNKLNVVYSTNPNFDYSYDENEEVELLSNNEQRLYVSIDKKRRAGKEVTLVEGFIGPNEYLKALAKSLKSKCGVGGAAKEGEIIIQGNFKDKIYDLLIKEGFLVKKKGGI